MKSASLSLLPQTVFNTASGNYDGVATGFSGVPIKASAYYSKDRGLQTIAWSFNGLEATVVIEGTLDSDPDTATYFPLLTVEDVAAMTENDFQNLEGNFTWIRASVENFTAGEIRKVTVSYWMDLLELFEKLNATTSDEEFLKVSQAAVEDYISELPEDKQQRARAQQWKLEQDLRHYKDPTARFNRMVEIFWEGFREFQAALDGCVPEKQQNNVVEFKRNATAEEQG